MPQSQQAPPYTVQEARPLTPVDFAAPAARQKAAPGYVRSLRGLSDRFLVPLVGTVMVGLMASEPLEGSVLAFLAFLCAAFVLPASPAWATLLPLMRAPVRLGMPVIGIAALALVEGATGLPGLDTAATLAVLSGTSVAAMLPYAASRRLWRSDGTVRTAVIGSRRSVVDLSRELELAGIPDYVVVGRVEVDQTPPDSAFEEVPTLGSLHELSTLVERHDIDLLVMTGEVPRFSVFDEISRSCLHLPVRLWELSGFYEDVFGHVPVADINPSWFQYIMHPKYRAVAPASKRALDLAVAVLLGFLFLPLVAVLALLIRRDGGPVLFKQTRIGEGGRPLTVYKLRTMRVDSEATAQWAEADDPRITGIGRVLRRTHLDELPQLVNVLRGEMSLVGPRPEQPEFVDRLEEVVPFYQRRHLVKPGITGWAQVRCGYAGSDIGSAWKLSHDLFYLKHRSMAFDLSILGETLRTLVADRRYAIEPKWVSFIHGEGAIRPVEPLPVAVNDS
jgi:exopolysaccharide biosynthesis polyprenyl glycosylphosphotransferase